MRQIHLAAILFCFLQLSWRSVTAQAIEAPVVPVTTTNTSRWPTSAAVSVGRKVKIVTVAAPKRMRSCTVDSLDELHIACSRRFGLKPISYSRQDVAAILTPGTDSPNKREARVCAVVTGGMMTGSVVWGARGSSRVGPILLGLVGFSVFGACAVGDNEDNAIPPVLLYHAPGQQLQAAIK